jgi:hypothetical protein
MDQISKYVRPGAIIAAIVISIVLAFSAARYIDSDESAVPLVQEDKARGFLLWQTAKNTKKYNDFNGHGGEGGIRTHGGVSPTAVFKTAALNHSATSPD